MAITTLLFIIFLIAVGGLATMQDWRVTVALFAVADLCRIGLLQQAGRLVGATSTLLAVELLTTLGVVLILLVTALTFTRDYGTEDLDEFALMELRMSARRSQQRRTQIARSFGALIPFGAVVLAGLATWLIGASYPIAREGVLDAAWLFALLCGLLVLITAGDVLKLGLGLLLVASSAKVLYFSVAAQPSVLHVALLEIVGLALAISTAYLSGLLYGRLRTLEFGSLFDRS